MMRLPLLVLGLLIVLTSCAPSLEDQGDKYTKQAKSSQNVAQRFNFEKAAYKAYYKAYHQKGDKSSQKLKSKYLGAIVTRMRNVGSETEEGFKATEVTELLLQAKKVATSGPIDAEFADMYALYLMDYAKELKGNNITGAIEQLTLAQKIAADKTKPEAMLAEVKKEFLQNKLSQAKNELSEGIKNEDEDAVLRADYYAREVLHYDSTNADAQDLLKKSTKKLIGTYAAYDKVFDVNEKEVDTTLYSKINAQRVFMGFSEVLKKRTTLTLEGKIINDSYNPVRMRKELFTLVLEDGKELKPTTAEFNKKIVDIKHEAEIDLKFTGVTATPKMVKYKNVEGDITSDKLLMY